MGHPCGASGDSKTAIKTFEYPTIVESGWSHRKNNENLPAPAPMVGGKATLPDPGPCTGIVGSLWIGHTIHVGFRP